MIGRKVGGAEIRSVIRQGPLGPQYLAKVAGSGLNVVLQLLPEALRNADADTLDKVLEQARAAAALREPEVLRLIRADRDDGRIFFITEYAAGTAASDLGRMSPALATRLARGTARALAKAHSAGIIHRDVRPENILLCDDGTVRLMGLGLTTAAEAFQELRLGLPIASPAYCSPELYQEQTYTHRTDVYSLGAVYFHLLTGRPPFQAATSLQVLHQHRTEPPPDARDIDDAVPAGCSAIVVKAMAKDPDARYRYARDMAEALEVMLESLPPDPELEAEPEGDADGSALPAPAPAGAEVTQPIPTRPRSDVTMPIPPRPLSGERPPVPPSGARPAVTSSGTRPAVKPPSGARPPAELAPRRPSLVVNAPAAAGTDSRRRSVRGVAPARAGGWPWVAAGAVATLLVIGAVFVLTNRPARPVADAAKKADPPPTTPPGTDPAPPDDPPIPGVGTEPVAKFEPPVAPTKPAAPTFATDDEGFIRNWLILGMLPYNAPNDNEALVREQVAGEAALRPKEGDSAAVGDKQYMWKACQTNDFQIDLKRDFGRGDEDCVAYGVCYVIADADTGDAKLKVGTDDHGRVYLNGREIHRKLAARAVKKDDDVVWPVQLKKGVNVLLVKVVNMKGDFGFCARFTDRDDKPIKGLRIGLAP